MSKKSLLLIIILFSFSTFSQDTCSRFSIGLNSGLNFIQNQKSTIKTNQASHFGLSAIYGVGKNFGFMGSVGYDRFPSIQNTKTVSQFGSLNFQAVYNVGNLVFNSSWKKIELFVHGGGGIATLWNPDFKKTSPSDRFIKPNDDMLSVNAGITPRFRLSKQISFNLDFAYSLNILQNHYFTWTEPTVNKIASIYTLSVGLSYHFGGIIGTKNPPKETQSADSIH